MLAGAAELPSNRGSDAGVLRELDECIQQRFLGFSTFGVSRVLPQAAHGVRQFRPVDAKERETVDRLEQQGYEVALYLAGRGILDPPATGVALPIQPAFDLMPGVLGSRREVQGPAFITRLDKPQDLPEAKALLADARAALASFDRHDGSEVQENGWKVRMRPLRATSQACVACHTSGPGGANHGLKIGDALGVVLYVSRAK